MLRRAILRCYWDGEATPSVEVPLGDFFTLAQPCLESGWLLNMIKPIVFVDLDLGGNQ